jgi:hypothetical protein
MSHQYYSETRIYRYWQEMRMPDAHRCVVCEKKLRPNSLVYVYPFMDEEDGGAACSQCEPNR